MNAQRKVPAPMVWWILWVAILNGVIMIRFVLKRPQVTTASVDTDTLVNWMGLLPLMASCVVRWAVLPRLTSATKALPLFIVGMAMAEGCAVLGILLGGRHSDLLFAAGVIGVVQFVPIFIRRFEETNGDGIRRPTDRPGL